MDKKDDKVTRSARNIALIKTIGVNSLNVLDILKHQYILMTVPSLKKIDEIFTKVK